MSLTRTVVTHHTRRCHIYVPIGSIVLSTSCCGTCLAKEFLSFVVLLDPAPTFLEIWIKNFLAGFCPLTLLYDVRNAYEKLILLLVAGRQVPGLVRLRLLVGRKQVFNLCRFSTHFFLLLYKLRIIDYLFLEFQNKDIKQNYE